ncbi:uncharacterized protein ASCRUDRAFT_81841 [Ascoidea rubescens DSM 1968]|uniref:PWWP domain-containing protein n=1 Tax=Ascoidea rubescens DSM 1968 TaxID=1344418 RepID=A0A1D2VDD6_9ASCO|nr:hypothetical protein ASCRUDRAFT_81841 [Ascoidea rubescens DSM 1968]ODV59503.1 hypothetical protein ASCRUDRAFT_81841 [Ascoidea rubescens DSM 1968]
MSTQNIVKTDKSAHDRTLSPPQVNTQSPPLTDGSIVLAKVKGFPPWPGMIIPQTSAPINVLLNRPKNGLSSSRHRKKTKIILRKSKVKSRQGVSKLISSEESSLVSEKDLMQVYLVKFFIGNDYMWANQLDLLKLSSEIIEKFLNEIPVKKSQRLLHEAYKVAKNPPTLAEFLGSEVQEDNEGTADDASDSLKNSENKKIYSLTEEKIDLNSNSTKRNDFSKISLKRKTQTSTSLKINSKKQRKLTSSTSNTLETSSIKTSKVKSPCSEKWYTIKNIDDASDNTLRVKDCDKGCWENKFGYKYKFGIDFNDYSQEAFKPEILKFNSFPPANELSKSIQANLKTLEEIRLFFQDVLLSYHCNRHIELDSKVNFDRNFNENDLKTSKSSKNTDEKVSYSGILLSKEDEKSLSNEDSKKIIFFNQNENLRTEDLSLKEAFDVVANHDPLELNHKLSILENYSRNKIPEFLIFKSNIHRVFIEYLKIERQTNVKTTNPHISKRIKNLLNLWISSNGNSIENILY